MAQRTSPSAPTTRQGGCRSRRLSRLGKLGCTYVQFDDTSLAYLTTRISTRGNFRSSRAAEGGYDFVAETLFNELEVDGSAVRSRTPTK